MQSTSYTIAQANRSHVAHSRAILFKNGVEQSGALDVVGGSVSVDASAKIRRRAKLSLAGYHPEIDPFDCEIRIERSIDDEYVPLGVFRVEDPTFTRGRDSVTTELDGFDRAHWLSALRLTSAYSIVADGTQDLVHNAIANLLLSRTASLTLQFQASTFKVPAMTLEEQSDPWEKAMAMAESAGMELFFNPLGICVLRPVPTDTDAPVVTYGEEARILKLSKKQSTKGTYSRAIVTGENPNIATPIRGTAVDNDPTSPTYYLGTFGDRPTWLRSQFITTQAQADAAASALLARKSGRAEQVSIDGIVNPAMDANDLIGVHDDELDLDTIAAVDTLEIPLGIKAPMRLGTRERRVA